MNKEKNKKGKTITTVIIIIIIAIILGVVGWILITKSRTPVLRSSTVSQTGKNPAANNISTLEPIPENLKTYENTKYNFSLDYPGAYTITETNGDGETNEITGAELLFSVDIYSDKNIPGEEVNPGTVGVVVLKGYDPKDILGAPPGLEPVSTTDTVIDGLPAKRYDLGTGKYGSVLYVVANGQYRYEINLDLANNADNKSVADFNDIIASFGFIE